MGLAGGYAGERPQALRVVAVLFHSGKSVGDYVHLNPARAKRVAADAPLQSFAWSSWPAWVRVDRWLGEWGIPKESPAGRPRLKRALEKRRGAKEGEEFKPIRRGWGLVEETFREELLTQMSERMGAEPSGEERAETTMTVGWIAERLVMGTRGYLNPLLYRRRKPGGE